MVNHYLIRFLRTAAVVVSLGALGLALPAFGGPGKAGDKGHAHAEAIGVPGLPEEATRTVKVVMADNYFEPERLEVAYGETVRFLVRNMGSIVHEFNIGTPHLHRQHQADMKMMFEHGAVQLDKINHDRMKMDMGNGQTMDHDDPNSVLLEPGKEAEIVWKFAGSEQLEFACNMPGHYESGMVGAIALRP